MKLLYNFASRSRPDKLFGVLDNITNLSKHDNYEIIITADLDDSSMYNREVIDKINTYTKVKIFFGTSKNKIDAINKNVAFFGEFNILVNISDDQLFLIDGFDLEIIKDMQEFFPDTDGFLHYPDSHAKEKLPTMSIMGKKYFDRTGKIYNEKFSNVYCDNLAMDEAIYLGKYKFIDKKIFDHFHPVWGMADWDEQYRQSENPISYAKDQAIYLELKKALV